MNDKEKRPIWLRGTLLLVLLATVCLALVLYALFRGYERSWEEAAMEQQKPYVELVLAELSARLSGGGEESALAYLASLESSEKRYWLLWNEQTLLFVQDMATTERYADETASAYFDETDWNRLDALEPGQSAQGELRLSGRRYLFAAASVWEDGHTYTLCGLLHESALRESASLTAARVRLAALFALVALLLLLVPTALAGRVQREIETNAAQERQLRSLRHMQIRWSAYISQRELEKVRQANKGVFPGKEYRLKLYLNARCDPLTEGLPGRAYPHTWEFVLHLLSDQGVDALGQELRRYLKGYENTLLNKTEPFDLLPPTLESLTETFAAAFAPICREHGALLQTIEGSETPNCCYVLRLQEETFKQSAEWAAAAR